MSGDEKEKKIYLPVIVSNNLDIVPAAEHQIKSQVVQNLGYEKASSALNYAKRYGLTLRQLEEISYFKANSEFHSSPNVHKIAKFMQKGFEMEEIGLFYAVRDNLSDLEIRLPGKYAKQTLSLDDVADFYKICQEEDPVELANMINEVYASLKNQKRNHYLADIVEKMEDLFVKKGYVDERNIEFEFNVPVVDKTTGRLFDEDEEDS